MDVNTQTNQKNRPLTRFDVERLIQEAGSTNKLDLSYQNLQKADLTHLILSRANLREAYLNKAYLIRVDLFGANLRGANLREANLSKANLREADLSGANLSFANLRETDLSGANLSGANLRETDLSGANLSGVDLSKANLSGANLSGANLSGANLSESHLIESNLIEADLFGVDLSGANLSGAKLTGSISSLLGVSGIHIIDDLPVDTELPILGMSGIAGGKAATGSLKPTAETELGLATEDTTILHLRIAEEPLTLHNLSTALSALTELSTKCWLISKGRFADLVEYTQTRNKRFDEESGLIISSITYNSPINIKLNFSIENVAKSVQIIIDAVIGAKERKKRLELENKKLKMEIKEKEQEIEIKNANGQIENQKALIELYDKQLDLRRKQIDLFDYASEKVPGIVEMLNQNAGTEDKKIASHSLVKSILGLGEVNGLELIPPSQESNKQIDAADSE